MLEVRARRDLGHDAAVASVLRELREQALGEDRAVVPHHRRRRLVAARLDAKHDHGGRSVRGAEGDRTSFLALFFQLRAG